MAASAAHRARAEHNRALYTRVEATAPTYTDWQVVALFYAALQYVDAYLAEKNIHPHDHTERGGWVAREAYLRQVSADYNDLRNRSEDVRYRLVTPAPGFHSHLHAGAFTRLRDHILKALPPLP